MTAFGQEENAFSPRQYNDANFFFKPYHSDLKFVPNNEIILQPKIRTENIEAAVLCPILRVNEQETDTVYTEEGIRRHAENEQARKKNPPTLKINSFVRN